MYVLQYSKNKNEILNALGYFTGFAALYADEIDAIEPIIKLVKKSRKSEIRKKAISALGRIGKKPQLVIPVLKEALLNDKSNKVRAIVPLVLYNFRDNALPILKDAIKLDNTSIRMSTAKALGHLSEYHDEALAILKNEFPNCKNDVERFEFLLAMFNLEGLESPIREEIEILLENLPNKVKS